MFRHLIPCATASEIYLKNQSCQAISCVVFQNYCLTRNQIIGNLCANLFSFSVTFHLKESPVITKTKLCNSRTMQYLSEYKTDVTQTSSVLVLSQFFGSLCA
jgi:hypothetical protein